MFKDYIEVKIPILDDVDEMKVVKTFTEEQLWYVCALAKAFENLESENKKIKQELNKKTTILNMFKMWLETNWRETQDVWYVKIINKLKEIEKSDNDE
jgi:hypothetical protein